MFENGCFISFFVSGKCDATQVNMSDTHNNISEVVNIVVVTMYF